MQEQIEACAGLNGGGAGHDIVLVGDTVTDAPMPRRWGSLARAMADPAEHERLRRRVMETTDTYDEMAEPYGVSGGTLWKYAQRQRWPRPPDARKRSGAGTVPNAGIPTPAVQIVHARLLDAVDRQVGLVSKRLSGKGAEVEERDSRILGNLAKTLGTLMQMGGGAKTSNDAETPTRGEDVERRLAERIKAWARGEQGY